MRLTAEDIANAFEVTGLHPVRQTFGEGNEGCGMRAYALAHEEFKGVPTRVSLKLVGGAYFDGFMTGWDYGPEAALPEDQLIRQYGSVEGMFRYLDGIADGAASAEVVFARAAERELAPA